MEDLAKQFCTPCKAGEPSMNQKEISHHHKTIPDWEILEQEGIFKLSRRFTFKNFQQALDFTNRIGLMAEEAGHHPAILTEWGKVTVTLWTYKIKGLHLNDFILAAKIDQFFRQCVTC